VAGTHSCDGTKRTGAVLPQAPDETSVYMQTKLRNKRPLKTADPRGANSRHPLVPQPMVRMQQYRKHGNATPGEA